MVSLVSDSKTGVEDMVLGSIDGVHVDETEESLVRPVTLFTADPEENPLERMRHSQEVFG